MNRNESLKHFDENIVKELINKCKKEFYDCLSENEERFGRLIIDSIKKINEDVLKIKDIDENYEITVLQFEFLRINILQENYKIILHAYNKLWYLDTNSVCVDVDLTFLSEPFIKLKEQLLQEKKIYIGKINDYDIQKVIFDVTSECFNSMSEIVRSYLWDLDEEEWISKMLLSDFYIIKWSEYKGKSETVFAMDNRKKTKEDLITAKSAEKEKMSFVYSVWKDSEFKDCDLSKENMLFINFKFSTLDNISFEDCHIVSGEFKYSKLKKCKFEKGIVVGTTFEKANVKDCNFEKCDLRSGNFRSSCLEEVNFTNSSFELGNFDSANLFKVSFKDCKLKDSDFRGAQFKEVDFEGADLENVIFSRETIPYLHLSAEQLQDILIEDGEE